MTLPYLILIIGLACAAEGAKIITITPQEDTEPLLNPGKGWILYSAAGGNDNGQESLDVWPKESLALATMAYYRYGWNVIEPEEGKYNWKLLDDDIAECKKHGLKCRLGVWSANATGPVYVTPKFVFNAGAKSVRIPVFPDGSWSQKEQVIPVFDDPVYLKKLEQFVNAFAKRYDGNETLAMVDIRSYGTWGDGFRGRASRPVAARRRPSRGTAPRAARMW